MANVECRPIARVLALDPRLSTLDWHRHQHPAKLFSLHDMAPTEQNLILLAIAALVMLVVAAAISRVAGKLGRLPGASLRVVAAFLFFVAFLPLARTLWWQFDGSSAPGIIWWRSPSFYITAAVVLGGLAWLRSQ